MLEETRKLRVLLTSQGIETKNKEQELDRFNMELYQAQEHGDKIEA